jgi:acyl-CoA dehydrogenase
MVNEQIDAETARQIHHSVEKLCARFGGEYWRRLDRERACATEFVRAMTEADYLGVLVSEEYGESGQGISMAANVLEAVHASGANAAALHAQMYTMVTLLRHGSEVQKRKWLPRIAEGSVRLQASGVTEPVAGTDQNSIRTFAERRGDRYVVNGQKVWVSRAEHSDLMILLARTTPADKLESGGRGCWSSSSTRRRRRRAARASSRSAPC